MEQCYCDAYMAMEEGIVQNEDRSPHANLKLSAKCMPFENISWQCLTFENFLKIFAQLIVLKI